MIPSGRQTTPAPPPPRTPMTTTDGATRATRSAAAASRSGARPANGVISGKAAIGRGAGPGGNDVVSCSASFTDRHLDILQLPAPNDPDRQRPADPVSRQPILQFFDFGHRLAGQRHDD